MLRDLFLWSVYAGYSDIAFVLLLQIKSRMSAALVAASIARHLSASTTSMNQCHRFDQQAKEYETYATECITACYNQNQQLACQLLLRENQLFGNTTCMQDDPIHWTTIYIIITISTMLIENIRKVVVDYHTQMLETWYWSNIWLLPMYATPYILFAIGIILYSVSANHIDLFTTAKYRNSKKSLHVHREA
ncbi:unnamed protein product [Rotaria sp. Silwood2]|nr:unnamed protein product [Rotaria sp. Silwood2]CAF4205680.1 unnamed protein product [Rotaria sp. Silwood2]